MNIKNLRSFQRVAIGLLLIVSPCSSLLATTAANYAEMVAALTTMATDIAARHYAFKEEPSTALKLQCATSGLSLVNKGLFFHNNIAAKQDLGGWSFDSRDCYFNAALAARDTTKFAQHLYQLYTSLPEDVIADIGNVTPETLQAALDMQIAAEKTNQKKQKSKPHLKLDYLRKVVALPLLKGLSSFALACTQEYATSYSGQQARFTATAAHCFTNLLDEYSNLEQDSLLTRPLIAALLINALWLVGETSLYMGECGELQNYVVQNEKSKCHNADLRRLRCGHRACVDCLQDSIRQQLDSDPEDLDHVECNEPGCNHRLSRIDVQGACNNAPDIMQAYDIAKFNRPPEPAPKPPKPGDKPAPVEEEVKPLPIQAGKCTMYGCEDESGQVVVLGCGHAAQCLGCRRIQIRGAFHSVDGNLDQMQCFHKDCKHHLTRNEVAALTGKDGIEKDDDAKEEGCNLKDVLDKFDRAAQERAAEGIPPDAAEQAAIARHEIQVCPQCLRRSDLQGVADGCNYRTCECGQHFCFHCGIALENARIMRGFGVAVDAHGYHYEGYENPATGRLVGDGHCPLFYFNGQPRVDVRPRGLARPVAPFVFDDADDFGPPFLIREL